MNTCFPARKQNGENYTTLDEMMGLIGQEPHGSWLAGTNKMWHGGLHITQKSAPGSVLTPETMETAVPLQCMADGEVVAWRLNKDYQKSTFLGQSIQYTTTFVLVKSVCQPAPNNEQTWLEFYSLYMGLAPLSAFEKRKCMKVIAENGVKKHPQGNYEASQSDSGAEVIPEASDGTLVKDTRVLLLKEGRYTYKGQTSQPFGLAQTVDSAGKASGKPFWVTTSPENMVPDGEQYAHLPVWMQQAVVKDTFDSVVRPDGILKINAGDAIGFLGEDISPASKAAISNSTFAHVEVLCADSRMPAFIDNPGKVTTGRKYIRVHPTAMLYTNAGDTFAKTTSPVSKDMHLILPVDKCNPKENDGKKYYQAGQNYWLSQDDVDLIDQYSLKELGFTALVEESTPDMGASLKGGWMKSAYQWLAEQVRPERGIQEQQMSLFYKGMIDKMDTDKDGQLSERELFVALNHPEMGVRDIVSRMIVKHESEWFGGSGHQKWTAFFQDYDTLRIDIAKKWLDDMEWMSQVEPFKSGNAVWHMHPVMFLDSIRDSESDEMDTKWLKVPKGQLTFNAEGNDTESSIFFSRHPHVPNNRGVVIGLSGVTFGRGLDFGQQSKAYIQTLFKNMERDAKPLPSVLEKWLLGSVGLKGSAALTYCLDIDKYVPKSEQYLTRKQQHFLFNAVYEHLYDVTKRVISKGANVDGVQISAELGSYSQNVQDVLVDLTFRGDNSPRTRKYFMKDLKVSEGKFKSNISNDHWKVSFGVPEQRFNERKGYL